MMDYSHAPSENSGETIKTEDIITLSTYEQLSMEFQKLYPTVSRAIQLVSLMYNRLTIVDKLSHKKAIAKIYEDHKHLAGFSQRNIRRNLALLDNPNIPHRSGKKIGPNWPNYTRQSTCDKCGIVIKGGRIQLTKHKQKYHSY